jgi:predicted DNA-binding protein
MKKDQHIIIRVNEEERQRYAALVRDREKPLSKIIREALDAMAERMREKQ